MKRRRFAETIALLVTVACLITGCGKGKSQVEASPFAPHWALTTKDVGGTLEDQGGYGYTVDYFGQGNCENSLAAVSSAVFPITRLGAPTESTTVRVGNFEVRSQVTQLKGKPEGKNGDMESPAVVASKLHSVIYQCTLSREAGKGRKQVVVFKSFGDGADMSPATGMSTFGWSAKLVPPWGELDEDGPTLAMQQKQNATEWYEEAWYTITSDGTFIVLAIQGPSDPSKKFNFQKLLDTMVNRVHADPPATTWSDPGSLGW